MGRREQSNQRFRHGFLADFAGQVRTFARQLRSDPDPAGVAFELERLAERARTLELEALAVIADDAARELAGEALGLGALRRVATAVRQARGRMRVGAIVVVGGDAEAQARIRADAEWSAEPVQLFADIASFASDVHPERPEAVVLPQWAHDAIEQASPGSVVIAHGDPAHREVVDGALRAGAHGLLASPLRLSAIARAVRQRGRTVEAVTVLLAHEPGPEREALTAVLASRGARVVGASGLAEVAANLAGAHVLVVGPRLGDRGAAEVVGLARAYALGPVPVVGLGEADALPDAVDQVGPWTDPGAVAERILGWVRVPPADPEGPLQSRLEALEALDRALARHSRSREPLTVALIDVVEAGARGPLARRLRDGLRRGDAVGALGAGQWLVVLEHCVRADAEARLGELLATTQHVGIGLADTTRGARGLAARAEADLGFG